MTDRTEQHRAMLADLYASANHQPDRLDGHWLMNQHRFLSSLIEPWAPDHHDWLSRWHADYIMGKK